MGTGEATQATTCSGPSGTDAASGPAPLVLPDGLAEIAPGPQLSRVLARLDPARLTGSQLVVTIAARNRQIAHEQAQLLAALQHLGHAPPTVRDAVVRDPAQNPFATVEAAFSSAWTQYRAEQMMQLARFVNEQVPALGEAMSIGRVDLDKVKIFHTMLVGVVDVELMRRLVALALPGAERGTTAGLRARLQRLLARFDPESLRKRRQRDHDQRFVSRQPDAAGLVTLYGRFLDESAATAAFDHIDAIAKATHTAGDPLKRTMDQLRTDVYVNLLTGVDPTRAGYATPAERKGTITLHVNLSTLTGLTAFSGVCQHPSARERAMVGRLFGAVTRSPAAGSMSSLGRTACAECLAELADTVSEPGELAGYGPLTAHIARETAAQLAQISTWRFAVSSDDGSPLAEGPIPAGLLPDMTVEVRRWAADATAGPDGRVHRRPTAAQIAFVRARDRHCQAPGCRVPAHRCEIDHRIPWGRGGPTVVDSLYCLCKRHHRAKDEAGYAYHPGPDGIHWTTPYGHRYIAQALHRLHPDDDNRRRKRSHRRLGISVAVNTDLFHLRPPPTLRR